MKENYKEAEIEIIMLDQKEDIYCVESGSDNIDDDPGWEAPISGN